MANVGEGWLDGREALVLQLLACGYARAQIAVLLDTTPVEVEARERRACSTLGAGDTATAIDLAVLRGVVLGRATSSYGLEVSELDSSFPGGEAHMAKSSNDP